MAGLNWTLFGHLPRLYENATEERALQDALRRSLNDRNPYKQVLDPSATSLLQTLVYTPSHPQKSCSISLDDFVEGEEIIQLPCNHIFKPTAINDWLKNEKAECPICRYTLPFIEIRDESVQVLQEPEPSQQEAAEIQNNVFSLLSSLQRIDTIMNRSR